MKQRYRIFKIFEGRKLYLQNKRSRGEDYSYSSNVETALITNELGLGYLMGPFEHSEPV